MIRPELLGAYVNADDLEQQVRAEGAIDVGALGVRQDTAPAVQPMKVRSLGRLDLSSVHPEDKLRA